MITDDELARMKPYICNEWLIMHWSLERSYGQYLIKFKGDLPVKTLKTQNTD